MKHTAIKVIATGILTVGGFLPGALIASTYYPSSDGYEEYEESYSQRDSCVGDCSGYCDFGPAWIRAEYIFGFGSKRDLPPLVIGSSSGEPVLYGDGDVSGTFNGGRITAGVWLDSCEVVEIEGSYTYLQDWDSFDSRKPFLARPYINDITGNLIYDAVAVEEDYSGKISIDVNHQVQLANLLIRYRIDCICSHLEAVMGYQMAYISDELEICTERRALRPLIGESEGRRVFREDRFKATNFFNGVFLGFNSILCFWGGELSIQPSVSVGYLYREVTIGGKNKIFRLIEDPFEGSLGAGTTCSSGGLLALPTNIGCYNEDAFGFFPQIEIGLSYPVSCNLRFRTGYLFSFLSNVLLAGDQIDLRINPTQLDGGDILGWPVPIYTEDQKSYALHTFSFGLEYTF